MSVYNSSRQAHLKRILSNQHSLCDNPYMLLNCLLSCQLILLLLILLLWFLFYAVQESSSNSSAPTSTLAQDLVPPPESSTLIPASVTPSYVTPLSPEPECNISGTDCGPNEKCVSVPSQTTTTTRYQCMCLTGFHREESTKVCVQSGKPFSAFVKRVRQRCWCFGSLCAYSVRLPLASAILCVFHIVLSQSVFLYHCHHCLLFLGFRLSLSVSQSLIFLSFSGFLCLLSFLSL